MKSLENDFVLILHSCLQIDEESRHGWVSASAPKLAQRLQQLAPQSCTDADRIISCLQRRRRSMCWCLLLLGGRVDVQLHAVTELFPQSRDSAEAAFLQQRAAELKQHQEYHTQKQELQLLGQQRQQQQQQQLLTRTGHQQQQQQQLQLGRPANGRGRDEAAATPGLLPEDGAASDAGIEGAGADGGGRNRTAEAVNYCTERLAAMLSIVSRDPDCTKLVAHLVLRRNGAPLAALAMLLAPPPPIPSPSSQSAGSAPALSPRANLPTEPTALATAAAAARALSYMSACSEVRGQLLAVGAVPLLLACLALGGPWQQHQHQQKLVQLHQEQLLQQQLQQQLAADAAQCLAHLGSLEAAGREMLRVQGPTGIQALVALLGGGFGAAAVEPAVRAMAALTAHPTLRPGLVAAGATESLMSLVERSGGPLLAAWSPGPPAGGGGGGGGFAVAAAPPPASQYQTMELALLALVRCIRSSAAAASASAATAACVATRAAASDGFASTAATSGGGGSSGSELPAAALQLLLDVAAMPILISLPPPQESSPVVVASAASMAAGGMDSHPQSQLPASAMAVVEATEALADMAREAPGALRLLDFAGHLVLLQRLLASMPTAPGQGSAAAAAAAASTSPPFSATAAAASAAASAASASLETLRLRQLDSSLRGLARLAMAAPSHRDVRLARTHEVLLHVMLALGLADRAGWWALQGLCALAADVTCATDLVAAGMLPPVVAALRGLAAAQPRCRNARGGGRYSRDAPLVPPPPSLPPPPMPRTPTATVAAGGGGATSECDMEIAHLLGLLLQNVAGHKALAHVAVAEGAVPAICEWLAVCAGNDDVEGAVLCCATLCLLGDGEPGALVEMVHADGIDTLVELLHPRWATAALVSSTVAAAVAVACRWAASAQAVRMAAGIPALADTLRGPHGLACCRAVVSALVDLIANDPPSLREIRTTNTVIALGTQLQLLPNNDPRSARIRLLLRQLGEDPDMAMRLASSEASNASHHHHHHHHHTPVPHTHSGLRNGLRLPRNVTATRLQLKAAAAAAAAGGGGSWRWRFARSSDSGPALAATEAGAAAAAAAAGPSAPGCGYYGVGVGVGIDAGLHRNFRASSPGAIVPVEPAAAAAVAGGSMRWRTATGDGWGRGLSSRDDLDSVLAALRGDSSYKSLRRASLQQLAKRMDASDFSDVEDDVEDYMASLVAPSRDPGGAGGGNSASVSRASSLARGASQGRVVTTTATVTAVPTPTSQPPASRSPSPSPLPSSLPSPSPLPLKSSDQGILRPAPPPAYNFHAPTPASRQQAAADFVFSYGTIGGSGSGNGSGGGGGGGCGNDGGGVDEGEDESVRFWSLQDGQQQRQQQHHQYPDNHDNGHGNSYSIPFHRYNRGGDSGVGGGGGGSSGSLSVQRRRSSDPEPPSIDFWLEAANPDECVSRHPSIASRQLPPQLQQRPPSPVDGLLHCADSQRRTHIEDSYGYCAPEDQDNYPFQPRPHQQEEQQLQGQWDQRDQQQEEEEEEEQRPPVGWRGRISTVFNPLRLFRVRWKGAPKGVGGVGPGGAGGGREVVYEGARRDGYGCGYGGVAPVACGRLTLQVDGDELVFWSADADA